MVVLYNDSESKANSHLARKKKLKLNQVKTELQVH